MSNSLATVSSWLDESRPSFEEMNLNRLDFNKEKEFMIQAFQANSYLLGMEANSVRNILVNCALTGITLNPILKFGYPVPRKGKLCLDVSYMGMQKILTDTGSVKSVKAGIVYSNEPFDIELGSGGYVHHKPYFGTGGKGTPIGCYSIAVLNDGIEHIHWMYEADIQAIKARSESVKSGKQSPWDSDYSEMAKKTVVKQHFKYLPKTERAQMAANAIAIDNDNNGIDFEREQREAARQKQKDSPVKLDTLNPDVESDVEQYNVFIGYFDLEVLPETLNDGKMNVKNQKEVFEKTFAEGKLLRDAVQQWEKYIKGQYDHYVANPIQKEEPKEQTTESETNEFE